MNVLAIETSCDETGAAVVQDGTRLLSNVVASQIELHRRYGGVVPEVASRQHILTILPVIEQALHDASLGWSEIGAVAVARGPGLVGALLVGVNAAKALAWSRGLPLIGVNHIEAHIYANWLEAGPAAEDPKFPLLCLIVSGGHTEIVVMRDHGVYERLGGTLDDAAGEAFDKAARILGLPYPGGPAIQEAARPSLGGGNIELPRAELRGTYNFSFSGLKTALLREVRATEHPDVASLAHAFQEAVVDILVRKTSAAAELTGAAQVVVAGGVAANERLRDKMRQSLGSRAQFPRISLCTDNAAMIAAAGYYALQRGKIATLDMDVDPNLDIAA